MLLLQFAAKTKEVTYFKLVMNRYSRKQTFDTQRLLLQSFATLQAMPLAHFFAAAHCPPQSGPVSRVSFTPLLQVAAETDKVKHFEFQARECSRKQVFDTHTPLLQLGSALPAPAAPQVSPSAHGPPLSMSVSPASFTPLLHVAAEKG
jgi:hypothetical protein